MDSGSERQQTFQSCCPRGTAHSWSSPHRSMTRCARRPTSWTGLLRKTCRISGMVINRVHASAWPSPPERALVARRGPGRRLAPPLEVEALRRHATLMRADRSRKPPDGALRLGSSGHCPDPGSVPLPTDVTDLGDASPCRRTSCRQGLSTGCRRLSGRLLVRHCQRGWTSTR